MINLILMMLIGFIIGWLGATVFLISRTTEGIVPRLKKPSFMQTASKSAVIKDEEITPEQEALEREKAIDLQPFPKYE